MVAYVWVNTLTLQYKMVHCDFSMVISSSALQPVWIYMLEFVGFHSGSPGIEPPFFKYIYQHVLLL